MIAVSSPVTIGSGFSSCVPVLTSTSPVESPVCSPSEGIERALFDGMLTPAIISPSTLR